MKIWQFNQNVMRWLVVWNIPNILIGAGLSRHRDPILKGVGSQNVGWGLINIAIAYFGGRATKKRFNRLDNPNAPEVIAQETRNMRRFLLLNTALDLLYVVGGWRLSESRGRNKARLRGVGLGIVLQGLTLFIWDVFLLTRVPVNDS